MAETVNGNEIEGLSDEALMVLKIELDDLFRETKRSIAQVDAELSERLRERTGRKAVHQGVEFRLGRGRRVVHDPEGLRRYLGDDYARVCPAHRPLIKQLRAVARERGEDDELVVVSYMSWKDSDRVTLKRGVATHQDDPF